MLRRKRIFRLLRPVIEFIEFRVLHIDDSPERIAGGVFAGVLIAYTPLLGLHIILALIVSTLFKVNKFTAVSFVWISNIFTIIPVYYPSYIVGRKVLDIFSQEPAMTKKEILTSLQTIVLEMLTNNIFTSDFWNSFVRLFRRLGEELLVGGVIIGIPVAAAAYYITLRIVSRHRMRMQRRKRFASR